MATRLQHRLCTADLMPVVQLYFEHDYLKSETYSMCLKHIEMVKSGYTGAQRSGVRVHSLLLSTAAKIIKDNKYHKTVL